MNELIGNFTYQEFEHSDTATKLNIDNSMNDEQKMNVKHLVNAAMQPLRNHFKKPVIITSGFRSKELNDEVGGAKNSQHLYGMAADFKIPGVEFKDIWLYIFENLIYDQNIWEKFGNREWIHVSCNSKSVTKPFNRRESFKLGGGHE